MAILRIRIAIYSFVRNQVTHLCIVKLFSQISVSQGNLPAYRDNEMCCHVSLLCSNLPLVMVELVHCGRPIRLIQSNRPDRLIIHTVRPTRLIQSERFISGNKHIRV